MKHRKEIDGLRALAVLPVIFYHSSIPLFNSGFIGVDIFFVISGYLITTIIQNELAFNTFSIASFYERRARRILPALFLVIAVAFPLSFYLLTPQYFKNFSQSVVATQFFASNILFWLTGNYFDQSSELKPLLHTWSLAVEEQYYLFYPLLLLFLHKYSRKIVISSLVLIFLTSLFLAIYYSSVSPSASFYLLHTRAWELILGGLASYNTLHYSNRISNILSSLGLFVVLGSFFYYDKTIISPSLFMLLPTLGAAFVLCFTNPGSLSYKLLGNVFLTSIGLISYSAYLWHQPILAIARHTKITDLTQNESLFLIILILLLSYFTWRYVERPFRNVSFLSRKALFNYSLITSVIFLFLGFIGHLTNGFIFRTPANHLPVSYFHYYYSNKKITNGIDGKLCMSETDSICRVNSVTLPKVRNILLVGDSHSGDYTNQFRNFLIDRNYNGSQMSVAGCGFVYSQFNRHNGLCGKSYNTLIHYIQYNHFDDIIFISSMYDHIVADADLLSTIELLNRIKQSTKRLWIFSPRLTLSHDPMRAANLNLLSDLNFISPKYRTNIDNMLFALEVSNKNIFLFDEMKSLYVLSEKDPAIFNAHTIDNVPLYIDTNHLNDLSANIIFEDFIKMYDKRSLN